MFSAGLLAWDHWSAVLERLIFLVGPKFVNTRAPRWRWAVLEKKFVDTACTSQGQEMKMRSLHSAVLSRNSSREDLNRFFSKIAQCGDDEPCFLSWPRNHVSFLYWKVVLVGPRGFESRISLNTSAHFIKDLLHFALPVPASVQGGHITDHWGPQNVHGKTSCLSKEF